MFERLTNAILRGAIGERLNVLWSHLLDDRQIAGGDYLDEILTFFDTFRQKIRISKSTHLFDNQTSTFGDFNGGRDDAKQRRCGVPHFLSFAEHFKILWKFLAVVNNDLQNLVFESWVCGVLWKLRSTVSQHFLEILSSAFSVSFQDTRK